MGRGRAPLLRKGLSRVCVLVVTVATAVRPFRVFRFAAYFGVVFFSFLRRCPVVSLLVVFWVRLAPRLLLLSVGSLRLVSLLDRLQQLRSLQSATLRRARGLRSCKAPVLEVQPPSPSPSWVPLPVPPLPPFRQKAVETQHRTWVKPLSALPLVR